MNQQERLIDLLKQADEYSASRCITDYDEAVADNAAFLLENGVIVPPCVVYNAASHQYQIITKTRQGYMVSEKTYPTRKEAKRALAERNNHE